MRGKELLGLLTVKSIGITPAYAGKRFRAAPADGCVQDHPRLCGEKLSVALYPVNAPGSPPPMRGKVAGIAALIAIFGITPAYAGKSHDLGKIDRKY